MIVDIDLYFSVHYPKKSYIVFKFQVAKLFYFYDKKYLKCVFDKYKWKFITLCIISKNNENISLQ